MNKQVCLNLKKLIEKKTNIIEKIKDKIRTFNSFFSFISTSICCLPIVFVIAVKGKTIAKIFKSASSLEIQDLIKLSLFFQRIKISLLQGTNPC